MKFTMFITEDAVQFNLTPENPHEKKFLGILSEYEGGATIHHGVNVSECGGGYIRDFGRNREILAVIIRPRTEPELTP
jgi:hypothetical protein